MKKLLIFYWFLKSKISRLFYRKRYFECYKCGIIAYTEDGSKPNMCVNSMPMRTSGICGGGFDEITKQKYIKLKKQFCEHIYCKVLDDFREQCTECGEILED